MSDPTNVLALTNTTPKSCVDVNCNCDTMWSLAQQFSSVRLCASIGERRGKLVRNYAVRARRIAATYARFYLEIEEGGNVKHRGRYYWMALGAFASKTVACTFDAWQVKRMTHVDGTVWEGLGKGNFWLFCDISGWHWYRNMYPGSFGQCLHKRNSKTFISAVQKQLKQLPWNAEALPVIKFFAPTSYIESGFKKVQAFENAAPKDRANIQFSHLMDIANHEQKIILQPLIYEDKSFARRIQLQRYLSLITPTVELVFSHTCTLKEGELKSIAPDDTELEDFSSRMSWITIAAQKFHNLMRDKKNYMEGELIAMAGWKDMPDTLTTMEHIKKTTDGLGKRFNDAVSKIRN